MSIFGSAVFSRKRPPRQQASVMLSLVITTVLGLVPGPRVDGAPPPEPESSAAQPSPASTATSSPGVPPSSSRSTLAQPSGAQPAGGGGVLLGNDVSWPQCNKDLPEDPAFVIVGVNNGLANTTNPCLHQELDWAEDSLGGTGQPTVALYVNTANPGTAGTWWPTSNEYGGKTVANPYGECREDQTDAPCAYMYGYAKAFDDAYLRSITDPDDYLWWLDVETGNTWSGDKTANRADLEGMTDFFHSIGARVGIYSTGSQWGQIVGQVDSGSSLYGLPTWLAGARTVTGAKDNCAAAPLTAGGKVVLTQFVSKGFDYDYSCI
ncbi:hypothetical protein ASG92_16440 [Arthrobacter sp. Soil736]|uniref:hypothetical protein n=1 Tax=Arthrobacter sp. Soil736 TaxID=1736395 RepID=UPI0006F8D6E2|nr:hypothetical protein [Arthrobacter sp. Soil736]KRE66182.1 hypothetical protein ASG92_16440 [Arthrobacter sp. Soil736]